MPSFKAPSKKKTKTKKRLYWDDPADVLSFSTGCSVLDLALGGGWARRQIVSVEGDNSTGKTLLAIEAMANFMLTIKGKKRVRYADAEAAFDPQYAESLGVNVEDIDFAEDLHTVEDFFEDLCRVVEESQDGAETLYILDSLDALSDREEMKRKIDEGTYGANKAKLLSQTFRRTARELKKGKVTLLVVNQVRENIAATFGKKTTTSGGKSLGFYAYQRVELTKLGQIKKTRRKNERTIGINVRAHVSKNKMGPPHRKVDFPLLFGYGIEDLEAMIRWLISVHRIEEAFDNKKEAESFIRALYDGKVDSDAYREERAGFRELCESVWHDIESDFNLGRRKY